VVIVFVATAAHRYTTRCLGNGTFGAAAPVSTTLSYEELLVADEVPAATYVFTDLERLQPWELRLAAHLYRTLRLSGQRCLNDPGRAMQRFELLRTLHERGFNPFDVYRADERPRPRRFPVFVRYEADHGQPLSDLLPHQAALEACFDWLRRAGTPLRGLLVVEYAAEPIAPGAFRKFGSFRIGDAMHCDHAVIENQWLVKYGTIGLATEAMVQVRHNAYAEAVRPAFEIAGIEWGRADHATVGGREVVYEINTNPDIGAHRAQRYPMRTDAMRFVRERMARLLHAIDSPPGEPIALRTTARVRKYRSELARVVGGWPRP